MNYFKRLTITILCSSFVLFNNSFTNLQQYVQIGTATAKLPAALIANYYDCNDDAKKALVADSVYRALYILDAGLKMVQSISYSSYNFNLLDEIFEPRFGNDVALLEMGLSVYDLYCIFRNIRNIRALNAQDKNSDVEGELIEECETLSQDDIELWQILGINGKASRFKKVLYTLIKTGALAVDSSYSCIFGLARGDWNSQYRRFNSWTGVCSRILASCFDNKNGEVNSKLVAILAAIGITAFSEKMTMYRHEPQPPPPLHPRREVHIPWVPQSEPYVPIVWDVGFEPFEQPTQAEPAVDVRLNRTTEPELEAIFEKIGLRQLFQHFKRDPDPYCSICFNEEFNDNVSVIDGCHHIFCRPCLVQAYVRDHRCPLCRGRIWGVRNVLLDRDS